MRKQSLKQIINGMRKPRPGSQYYLFETTVSEDGQATRAAETHWIGFTQSSPRREIREGSIVNPAYFIERWQTLLVPYFIVNTEPQMIVYRLAGGFALVEKSLAEKHFRDLVEAREVAPDGFLGFKSIQKLPRQSFYRAPSPRLRMKVLKRDDYRCRLCGRRAFDHADLELHVHHIHQWATGGLTEEENLITLCHTCHNGLDPHTDRNLFDLLGRGLCSLDDYSRKKCQGMLRYQQTVWQSFVAEELRRKAATVKR